MFNKTERMQDSLPDDRNHGPSHDDSTPKLKNKMKDKNAPPQIFKVIKVERNARKNDKDIEGN